MSAIISGIAHFFQAILEVIQGAISGVVSLIQQAFGLVFDLAANVVGLFQSVVGVFLGNIFIIAVIALLAYGFMQYQGKRGQSIGARKRI